MRRFFLSGSVAVAAAVILGACANEHASPTGVEMINGISSLTIAQNGCVAEGTPGHPTFAEVNTRVTTLINALFVGTHKQSTSTMWENLKTDKLYSNPLQNHVDNLTKWTLGKLGEGALIMPSSITTGPDAGLTPTTGSVRLLDLIFTCVSLTPSSVPAPPSGFDAAFALVDAVTTDQQVNTSFKDAAGFVKGGSLDARTMLVIVRQPPEVQVNTPFPKLSRTMDIALAGGKLKAGQKLTVLVCPAATFADDDAISHRGVIAHQKTPFNAGDPVGKGVEYLPAGEGGVLPCPESADIGAAWRQEKGFFRQRAMQLASLANKAWSYIGPKPLYAGHAAIGGGIEFFSPVVIVDTYIPTQVVVDPIATTTYGDAVTVNATLKVTNTAPANWAGTPAMNWVGKRVRDCSGSTDTDCLVGAPSIGTPLNITAVVDDANGSAHASLTQTVAIDGDSKAQFTFTHENANATHNAQLTFPQTLNLPGFAPVFVGSADNDNAFVVNPHDLDITAGANGRQYGYADDAAHLDHAFGGTITGTQYGDVITADYESSASIQSQISAIDGPYDVHVKAGSVAATGTALLSNYTQHLHTALFTIRKRALTGHVNGASRYYGDPNPGFTNLTSPTWSTASGAVDNPVGFADDMTVEISTTANNTTPVASSPVAITTSLTGTRAPNYSNGITNGALTINPAPLTLNATAATREYGVGNPAFGGTASGAKNGETINVTGATDPATDATSAVGTYDIVPALNGSYTNYVVTVVNRAKLSVTPAPLSVTIKGGTYAHDADPCEVNYSGFRNADGPGSLAGALSCTRDNVALPHPADAGTYVIAPVGLSSTNYDIGFGDGEVTVEAPPPALSSATFDLSPSTLPVGSTETLTLPLPALTSGAESAASVTLTISGCGSGSVPKSGGGAVTLADLGSSITINAPATSASGSCTYTLTVANSNAVPATAAATGTLTITAP